MKPQTKPTIEQFSAYQKLFHYYNKKLFLNELPNCILNFSRKSKANGFFAPDRWNKGAITKHEISLNPESLKRPVKETSGTLVHEMVHLWQQEKGNPSRTGYHNREWAVKMNDIGLIPDNGKGGETGQSVSHNIDPNGAFLKAFKSLPKDLKLPFECLPEPENKKVTKSKTVFICIGCDCKAWGKPSLNLICADCDLQMIVENS